VNALTPRQRFVITVALCTLMNISFGVTASFDPQVRGLIAAKSARQAWYAFTNHNGVYSYWSILTLAIGLWIVVFGQLTASFLIDEIYGGLRTSGYIALWLYDITVVCCSCVLRQHLVKALTATSGIVPVLAQIITVLTPLVVGARWIWTMLGRSKESSG
jgi:hypothetical protein